MSLFAAGAVWVIAVVAGFVALVDYSGKPSPLVPPPSRWPSPPAIELDASRPTLVMFVHPQCPCTSATLSELDRLMSKCGGQLAAVVAFYSEPGFDLRQLHGMLWNHAARIPGVHVVEDPRGQVARRFHAETSGTTALYGPDGRLLFYGGITMARGHEGDNVGAAAILAIVAHEVPAVACSPVYGCGLFDCDEGSARR